MSHEQARALAHLLVMMQYHEDRGETDVVETYALAVEAMRGNA